MRNICLLVPRCRTRARQRRCKAVARILRTGHSSLGERETDSSNHWHPPARRISQLLRGSRDGAPAFFDGTPTPTATLSSNRHRAVYAAHVFQHWSDVRLPDKRILLFAFQPGPADNGGRQVHRVHHESPRDNAEGTVRAATDDLSRPIGFVGLPFDLNQSRTSASSLVPDGMQRPTTR